MGKRRKAIRRNQPPALGPRRRNEPLACTTASGDAGAGPLPSHEVATTPRRLAAWTCGWCGKPISVKDTGRLPKWCSPACRQRAWEQSRAAASGLAAVRVVERRVEVPTPIAPGRQDWPRLLGDLAQQLEDGRIYDRDLLALAAVNGARKLTPWRRLNLDPLGLVGQSAWTAAGGVVRVAAAGSRARSSRRARVR
jgi:hypothetical protein